MAAVSGKSLATPVHLGSIGNSSDTIQIDTASSEIDDTEIGIFNSVGTLLYTNDDSSIAGTFYQAALSLSPYSLPDGTYYVIAGRFNTIYETGFSVTGSVCSTNCGMTLNVSTNGVQAATDSITFNMGETILYYLTFIVGPAAAPVASQNCFVKDSLVQTDQELIKIQNIIANHHTINNKPVKAITSALNVDGLLVKIQKDSLGENLPCEDTLMQKDHKLLISPFEFAALSTSGKISFVQSDPNELLYNVLLEDHEIMVVNGINVETQNPQLEISKYHLNPSNELKGKIEAETKTVPIYN